MVQGDINAHDNFKITILNLSKQRIELQHENSSEHFQRNDFYQNSDT